MTIKMTSPAETEAALRALRLTKVHIGGVREGLATWTSDRVPEHDVEHYLKFTRCSVAQIEEAEREKWHPELSGHRAQILSVLRPLVAWLDANPAEDPQIKDARLLPTSVLKEVLRERKEADRKAKRHARNKRDGYLVPLTDGDKQAMIAAADRVRGVPFAETPGRKATYPTRKGADFVDAPVVILGEHNGQHLARLATEAITLLPADWPLDFVDDPTWIRALAGGAL